MWFLILSAWLKMKANGKSIIQSYRSNGLSIYKLACMMDKCSYYLYNMPQLVQHKHGELTWYSAVKVLACRRFAFYSRIANAKSPISSVCELFPSSITAQFSPSAALRLLRIPLLVPGCNLLVFLFQAFPFMLAASFSQVIWTLQDTLDALNISVACFFSFPSTWLCWQRRRYSSGGQPHHGWLLWRAIAVKSWLCLGAFGILCMDKPVPGRQSEAM